MSCLYITGSQKTWSSISCTSGSADVTEEHGPTASSALRSTEESEQLFPKKLSGCFTLLGHLPAAAAQRAVDQKQQPVWTVTPTERMCQKKGKMCFNRNRAARWKRRSPTV